MTAKSKRKKKPAAAPRVLPVLYGEEDCAEGELPRLCAPTCRLTFTPAGDFLHQADTYYNPWPAGTTEKGHSWEWIRDGAKQYGWHWTRDLADIERLLAKHSDYMRVAQSALDRLRKLGYTVVLRRTTVRGYEHTLETETTWTAAGASLRILRDERRMLQE